MNEFKFPLGSYKVTCNKDNSADLELSKTIQKAIFAKGGQWKSESNVVDYSRITSIFFSSSTRANIQVTASSFTDNSCIDLVKHLYQVGDQVKMISEKSTHHNKICTIVDTPFESEGKIKIPIQLPNGQKYPYAINSLELLPSKVSNKPKFKKGDLVEVIGPDATDNRSFIGTIEKINDVYDEGSAIDLFCSKYLFLPSSLKYVDIKNIEFKVGDEVALKNKIPDVPLDAICHIVKIYEGEAYTIGLKIKNYTEIGGTHWTSKSNLVLIKRVASKLKVPDNKKSYLELHKASRFKVGDIVRIVRAPSTEEEKLWDVIWCSNRIVGEIGIVSKKDDESFEIKFSNDDIHKVPYFILEKVREQQSVGFNLVGSSMNDTIKYVCSRPTKSGNTESEKYVLKKAKIPKIKMTPFKGEDTFTLKKSKLHNKISNGLKLKEKINEKN